MSIVEVLLLNSEIDVNKIVGGENALLAATEAGHYSIVKILLGHPDIDINISKIGNTGSALFVASEIGHSQIAKELLLKPQIEVNNRYGTKGKTALTMALQNDYLNVVKVLLRCPKTNLHITELDTSQSHNDSVYSIRKTLLKSENTCCLNKNMGLIKAAVSGNYRAIKGLGQCPDVDVNTIDAKGRTPLYIASWFGHAKATEELLKLENIEFNKGRRLDGLTPISIASQKGHSQIMNILTNHSYINDYVVNNGWKSDEWTFQYGGYKFVIDAKTEETNTSNDCYRG